MSVEADTPSNHQLAQTFVMVNNMANLNNLSFLQFQIWHPRIQYGSIISTMATDDNVTGRYAQQPSVSSDVGDDIEIVSENDPVRFGTFKTIRGVGRRTCRAPPSAL